MPANTSQSRRAYAPEDYQRPHNFRCTDVLWDEFAAACARENVTPSASIRAHMERVVRMSRGQVALL